MILLNVLAFIALLSLAIAFVCFMDTHEWVQSIVGGVFLLWVLYSAAVTFGILETSSGFAEEMAIRTFVFVTVALVVGTCGLLASKYEAVKWAIAYVIILWFIGSFILFLLDFTRIINI